MRRAAGRLAGTLALALCVLGGLFLQAGFGVVGFKLVLVFVFLAFTTSTAAHALAKSALASGLEPITSGGHDAASPPDPAAGDGDRGDA